MVLEQEQTNQRKRIQCSEYENLIELNMQKVRHRSSMGEEEEDAGKTGTLCRK